MNLFSLKNFFLILLALTWGCTHVPSQRSPNQAVESPSQTEIVRSFFSLDQAKVLNSQDSSQTQLHDSGDRKVILIIHGLHESPRYMQGFSNYFYGQGYNVISLRLPGHLETESTAIHKVTAEEWIEAADTALKKAATLSDQIEILGYSTGGTLATYLALKYPDLVKKAYLIAPALSLSNQVFLTSRLIGWTSFDAKKICSPAKADKWYCRLMFYSDEQLKLMMDEGLSPSPHAGFEVQRLIEKMLADFSPPNTRPTIQGDGETSRNYFENIKETFYQLRIPILMVNSESDNVVMPEFNHQLMKNYPGPHVSLLYKKSKGISHLMIGKKSEDAFKSAPKVYNTQFDEMLEAINKVMVLQ